MKPPAPDHGDGNLPSAGSAEEEAGRSTPSWCRTALGLSAWGGALLAVLQLGKIPGDWGNICGVWGCGPTLKALVVWHAFCSVLAALPLFAAIRFLSGKWLRRLGLAMAAAGLFGLGAVAAWEATHWLPRVPQSYQRYFVARYCFRVAGLVDVPLVEMTVAGGICWFAGNRRRGRAARERSLPDGVVQ